MLKTATNIIIHEDIITKEYSREDLNGDIINDSYVCIEYDVVDSEGTILETWNWQIDSENTTPPTIEMICERTGIKFGVSQWEFPDDTIL
jgi:hypothetical protein